MRNGCIILAMIVFLLVTYVGSYLWLSRCGYADANRYGFAGFYYFLPEQSDAWERKNYGCVWFFWPLNKIDQRLGTGRAPGSVPMWGLSPAEPTKSP